MILQGLILSILFVLAVQDYRSRLVDIRLILGFAAISALYSWQKLGADLFGNWAINAGIFIFQLIIVTLIISVKNKSLQWIPDRYLGWGDIVFVLIAGLFFSPFYFVLYYCIALVSTLVVVLLFRTWLTVEHNNIPLITGLAITLTVVLLISWTIDINLYALF